MREVLKNQVKVSYPFVRAIYIYKGVGDQKFPLPFKILLSGLELTDMIQINRREKKFNYMHTEAQ